MREPSPQFKRNQHEKQGESLDASTKMIRENFANGMEDPQIKDADSYIERLGTMMHDRLDLEQGLFVVEQVLHDLERFLADVNREREPGNFVPDYLKEEGNSDEVKRLIMQLREWSSLAEVSEDNKEDADNNVINLKNYREPSEEASTSRAA